MVLKQLYATDAAAIARWHTACFKDNWSVDFLEKLFNNPTILGLGHVEKGGVISCALAQGAAGVFDILTFGCRKEYRQQGLGGQLLEALKASLIKKGCQELFLEVKNNNTQALSLYQKNGFKMVSIRKNYYTQIFGKSTDGVVMSLSLHQ